MLPVQSGKKGTMVLMLEKLRQTRPLKSRNQLSLQSQTIAGTEQNWGRWGGSTIPSFPLLLLSYFVTLVH